MAVSTLNPMAPLDLASSVEPGDPGGLSTAAATTMTATNMTGAADYDYDNNNNNNDMDIDMDMDIDLGGVDDFRGVEGIVDDDTQLQPPPALQLSFPTTDTLTPLLPTSEQDPQITPERIHIRGLDSLRTSDIRAFATEHYPSSLPQRIEWIDDTSANLVYEDANTARLALTNFFASSINSEETSNISPLQLRPAKSLSTHPGISLQVRIAIITDRKQPGARERSRFYLFNPEDDPSEHRFRGGNGGGRRRRNAADGDYHRRRFDREEHRRRREQERNDDGFDVNMYDDDGDKASLGTVTTMTTTEDDARSGRSTEWRGDGRRRRGRGGGGGRRGGRGYGRDDEHGFSRELFPDRIGGGTGGGGRGSGQGRLRDRSASPDRGDATMDIDNNNNNNDNTIEETNKARQRRYRDRSPQRRYASRDGYDDGGRLRRESVEREISPERDVPRRGHGGNHQQQQRNEESGPKELFPKKTIPSGGLGFESGFGSGSGLEERLGEGKSGGGGEGRLEGGELKILGKAKQHRRSDAFDAADETADLFAGKMTVPFMDGARDGYHSRSRGIHDRIGGGRGINGNGTGRRMNGGGKGKRMMIVDNQGRLTPPPDSVYAIAPISNGDENGDGDGDDERDDNNRRVGFSIRGAASAAGGDLMSRSKSKKRNRAESGAGVGGWVGQEKDIGFSIRGVATNNNNTTYFNHDEDEGSGGREESERDRGMGMGMGIKGLGRELFPARINNGGGGGSGLFGGGSNAGGGGKRRKKRNRAEDMFY
ncbi:MAG: hypothetical protein M1823_002990 [Watsoniomyces obsoletus]|nr:MAG: hypothetical protein M1823_002990 [Watsoniomyces obsoletus]